MPTSVPTALATPPESHRWRRRSYHRHTFDANGNSRPTSGCVSLGNDNLIFVLQRLVPGQAYFVVR